MNATDTEACYRAVESRDARFAGRFFMGVRTTGIYCRPGCPARLPKRQNVVFYPSAAAAEGEGFRACLRCRPNAVPGASATSGTGATISRALRLLEETGDARGLAERLGVGERHLRRLFAQHLGASPSNVLRTRRLHLARQLLEASSLPMTEVALSVGFSSLRRFNEAVREASGHTPTELRRGSSARAAGDLLELRLPYRAPIDFTGLLHFLSARAIPEVERIEGGSWRRAVRMGQLSGVLEVSQRPGHLLLRVPAQFARASFALVARVQRLFDLRADPAPIAAHLAKDPLLGPLVRPGLRVPGAWDPFEMAVRAVLGQQVSVEHARSLAGRLALEQGEPLPQPAPGISRLFPTAARLAEVELRGMPKARARAIRLLAVAVRDGALLLDGARDLETAVAQLTALPGIGRWTAEVIALRALGEPDAFPAGDLGLRRSSNLDERALLSRAEAWRPWRGYAALLLWMHESGGSNGVD